MKLIYSIIGSVLFAYAPLVAQTTEQNPYLRSDTLGSLVNKVYSAVVIPEWMGDSHYFWYKNHEKSGTFYYWVNAETGKKKRATTMDELRAFAPELWKPVPKRKREHTDERNRVLLPNKQWVAYVRDHNVYISPAGKKQVEEIALSMDGTFGCYYNTHLLWSPDSKKLATVKTRSANCRRIPLLESRPKEQLQPKLQWRDYAKPRDVLPISVPALFDVEQRKPIAVGTRPHEELFSLQLTGEKQAVTVLEKCGVSELVAEGWQTPEVFCAKGRDGVTDIWGIIYRPFNFDPSKSYPIIEDIYADPHDSHVPKDFKSIAWHTAALVEQGYIVVKIDGMGTNNRSKKFHDVCWKNLKDAGFPDRIQWILEAARKYKYMDT